MQKRSPDVKAIVTSGYSRDPAMVRFKEHGFQEMLRKSFIIEELSNELSKLI